MENDFSEKIFNPDFVLDGPHLVAASAGTGKTYNIQNIYARLVAEKGFRVSQIQVMTFTEAATKELRDRVRKVLAGFARLFADDTDGFEPKELERFKKLRDCARSAIGVESADTVARARVELALTEFDQASISTIHGFCRRALVRFAFETGSAFSTEFANTKSQDLSRRVRDWWRCERPLIADAVKDVLKSDALNEFVKELSQKSRPIVDEGEADNPEYFTLARAVELVDAYEKDRPSRDTQTFDDLLRGLQGALSDSEKGQTLAALLREEFKAVLVDEFQDTDPVQYDIFRRVFLDPAIRPAPTIFFVGDPKQAIYSFRGGDIYTYKKAVTAPAVAAKTFFLHQNFRSTPKLIDAVNALFMDEKRHDGSYVRTFGDDSIGYPNALKSSEDKAAFMLADNRPDPSPFRIVKVEKSKISTAPVVYTVLNILKEQRDAGISPKDIAILVSSHSNGEKYRDSLRAVNVPVVLQKAGNVFSGELAGEFRQVLMAMALTGGRKQIKTALLTRFFSFSAEDLADENIQADMVGFFSELNQKWLNKGFNAAFAALEANPHCDFRRHLATLPDGERLLADLTQIVDLAGSAVTEIGPAPESLVKWITERINQSEASSEKDSEEYARQLESENDALKIMTIHVSKGLEFPVVVIPISKSESLRSPYFYHDDNLDLRVGLSQEAKERAKREADDERMRRLYVAFTRATKRTIVITGEPPASDPLARLFANARRNGAGEDSPDSPIMWTQYVESAEPFAPYVPPVRRYGEIFAAKEPRHYSLLPSKGSYSSLSPDGQSDRDGIDHDASDVKPQPFDTEKRHAVFALAGGSKVGTCWHSILEGIDFAATDEELASATEKSLTLYGLPVESGQVVAKMMRATLDFQLTAPSGAAFALRDVPWADRFSEWEFDFSSRDAAATTIALKAVVEKYWRGDSSKKPFLAAMEGWNRPIPKGFLKGYLDLLFRHDGYYYVVDWKSNLINGDVSGFTPAGVADEMAEHGYFFQYLLYATVLHRFLKETLGNGYSWERNFGGVRYYFLRGIAAGGSSPVFSDRPCAEMLDDLAIALGLEVRK